jgi:hypothetical protein
MPLGSEIRDLLKLGYEGTDDWASDQ